MVNITGLIMRHRTLWSQNKRYSISICQLPSLTVGTTHQDFQWQYLWFKSLRKNLKGLKGANCSRELLQKDQAFSLVFSCNIQLPAISGKTKHIPQNPHITAKPLFLIFLFYSSTIRSIQPNQVIISQLHHLSSKHWRQKARHTQSWRILSPAEHGQHDSSPI